MKKGLTKAEKRHKRMMRTARKAPTWSREIAAIGGKISGWEVQRHKKRKLGTTGPASGVREIELTPENVARATAALEEATSRRR